MACRLFGAKPLSEPSWRTNNTIIGHLRTNFGVELADICLLYTLLRFAENTSSLWLPFTWCQIETSDNVIVSMNHIAQHTYRIRVILWLSPGKNGRHCFVDEIFKCIVMNELFCDIIRIAPRFVRKVAFDNTSALVPLTWINDDPLHWRIYATLRGDKLKYVRERSRGWQLVGSVMWRGSPLHDVFMTHNADSANKGYNNKEAPTITNHYPTWQMTQTIRGPFQYRMIITTLDVSKSEYLCLVVSVGCDILRAYRQKC